MTLMLKGNTDNRDELINSLQQEIEMLQADLAEARSDVITAREESARAVASLRRQLLPLYQALQAVFGEIEAIGPAEEKPLSSPAKAQAWESWKQRLGGLKAKCIDAFLTHGELTQTQLRVIVGCATSSVPGLISDLKQLGLLNKNGSKYSLKQL